jgi:hypothetical protein
MNVQDAKEALRQAKPLVSIGEQSVCDLSLAFLLAFEGDLVGARKIHRNVINSKNTPNPQAMKDVFTFLAQVIDAYPQKAQIRFVCALLNDEFGDKALAKEEFENYLAKMGDNVITDVGRWRREAKIRISRI